MSGRLAVVLFNLGGPDRPEAVQPFLFNLFNDPAIIGAPGPVRWLLAKLISRRRAPIAREIYEHLGGGSPLLDNTVAQAQALEKALSGRVDDTCRVFVSMRYWKPFSRETVKEVSDFGPDRIVLLPLYPQFSTTTTGSSLADWQKVARAGGIDVPTQAICCYPEDPGFVGAVASTLEGAMAKQPDARILFSAHGLPKKIVDAGDPYQWQVEQTAADVIARLGSAPDHVVCYQSRVGPLEWIGPSTEDEIARAGQDGKPVIVVPIAFVSEHSETLVELDIEYRKLAEDAGVPAYVRLPTVSTHPEFIAGLAMLVATALERNHGPGAPEAQGGAAPASGRRLCAADWGKCPCAA